MKITREWIESVSDSKGLTLGQQKLLKMWANEPVVGSTIPENIARCIETCKGYRGIPVDAIAFWGQKSNV